jgi:hypothetical protein
LGDLCAEITSAEVPRNASSTSEAPACRTLLFALRPPLQIEHVGPNVPVAKFVEKDHVTFYVKWQATKYSQHR